MVAAPLAAETFRLTAFVSGRGTYATGPQSWLAGGFGRLDAGADGPKDSQQDLFAVAQVGADWTPSKYFDVHASGVARRMPNGYGGRAAGLVDAYADVRGFFGANELQLRAGQFFLGTSRENRGDLWTSPYSITFSALNTWIGEEVRPVGADLQWQHTTDSGYIITGAATAFRNNDTMGTLLAWRGWSLGNYLPVYNEKLPLPPLFSLAPTGSFSRQQDGTVPFSSDLDGRTGYSERVRISAPERAMLQFTHVDNRGDRELYHGQYSWYTDFNLIGAEVGTADTTVFSVEYLDGYSEMGETTRPGWVDMDFSAWYALLSHKTERFRWTARFDDFATKDLDHSRGETNTEHGHAWTLAWFYDPGTHVRAGVEFVSVTGNRPAAAESGFDPNLDAKTLTLEVRYRY